MSHFIIDPAEQSKPTLPATIGRGMSQEDRIAFGNWLAGFTDGEGCFKLRLRPNGKGWHYSSSFALSLRDDDLPILEKIKSFLGCGSITFYTNKTGTRVASFRIDACHDLHRAIVPLFQSCRLRSKKARDIFIWSRAIDLLVSVVNRKTRKSARWTEDEHLKFSHLATQLKDARKYQDLQSELLTKTTKDDPIAFGHWLAGLADGEASFLLSPRRQPNGFDAGVTFSINLRKDDLAILLTIKNHLGCGIISFCKPRPHSHNPQARFRIHDCIDMIQTLLPLFEKCPLRAKKSRDLVIFEQGVRLKADVGCRKARKLNHSGFMPKWASEEIEQFISLAAELKKVRLYQDPSSPLFIKKVAQREHLKKKPILRGLFDGTKF